MPAIRDSRDARDSSLSPRPRTVPQNPDPDFDSDPDFPLLPTQNSKPKTQNFSPSHLSPISYPLSPRTWTLDIRLLFPGSCYFFGGRGRPTSSPTGVLKSPSRPRPQHSFSMNVFFLPPAESFFSDFTISGGRGRPPFRGPRNRVARRRGCRIGGGVPSGGRTAPAAAGADK